LQIKNQKEKNSIQTRISKRLILCKLLLDNHQLGTT
jgi:hypothetical protein